MDKFEIIKHINKLENPYTKEKVDFEKVLNSIKIDIDKIIIDFTPLGDDMNLNKNFNREVIKLLKLELKFTSVKITHPEPEAEEFVTTIPEQTKIIAIMSGKGGVGKSQVTVNTAKMLRDKGYKVAIMDADIYGYSIPKILDLYDTPKVDKGKIIPVVNEENIEVISAQYFLENNANEAIIWRASMVNKLMHHFFYDVKWSNDLDYLLIDLPPGTGDICLNVSQNLDNVKALVVTTANIDAAHVALRSGIMARDVNFELLGVIENMSYYEHNGEKLKIFGSGGASEVSAELDVPIITQIPIEPNQDKLQPYYEEIVEYLEDVI